MTAGPLSIGTRLGPYEVLGPLGAGGMGEVYRARDGTLQRDVALKILPASFTQDPGRVARFRREAQVLASLNHPHIAAIYGIDQIDGADVLVLELVDGESLDVRLARGRMPVDEAIAIARQVAEALEAAHAKGIVHRDLKSANIALTADGLVKVLDFGLAKGPDAAAGAQAATITTPAMMTGVGVILGTAAYMSPEQAKGKPVDKRADIWAFGVVLFEMMTGRQLFGGDNISDVLAGVLKEEPDWRLLPPETPTSVRRLLSRCLQKDPKQRLHDMADARLDLDDSAAGEPVVASPVTRSRILPAAAGVAIGATVTALALLLAIPAWRPASEAPVRRLTVLLPPGVRLFDDASENAISPDGRQLVFRTGQSAGPGQTGTGSRLWIRSLDAPTARLIAGTEEAFLPFWSPDSRRIGFFMQGKLKTVALDTGAMTIICNAGEARGATWTAAGVIVFAPTTQGGLMRVSATGGEPQPVTTLDAARHQIAHRFPWALPDGRHFLFTALPARNGKFETWVGSLDAPDTKLLAAGDGAATYAEPGYLLFMSQNGITAQRFDAARLQVSGEPQPVGDAPGYAQGEYTGARATTASADGTLAYIATGEQDTRLVWIDAASNKEVGQVVVPPAPYNAVRLAPDGRHAAVVREVSASERDIWIVDLERGGAVRLTHGPGVNNEPLWSPDGTRIAFVSNRNGGTDFFVKPANGGAPEQPLQSSANIFRNLDDWSPDGRFIIFDQLDAETGNDLWVLPLDGVSRPAPYLNTRYHEREASFSPDGRWVAYTSDESGVPELYVQSFPTPGEKYRVTTEGILGGWWVRSGQIVFIRAKDRQRFIVDAQAGPPFHTGTPRALGGLLPDVRGFDSVDGTRFLVTRPVGEPVPASLTLVLDWTAALRKR